MIQSQDTHTTFIKIHPGCLPLYVFDNSENYHKTAMDALNACKLNLKKGVENTPLLRDGYYKCPGGSIVVHAMYTEAGVQKRICTVFTERGLWVPGMKKQQSLQVLFHQDNFDPEKLSLILDDTVNSFGDCLDPVPKYHP